MVILSNSRADVDIATGAHVTPRTEQQQPLQPRDGLSDILRALDGIQLQDRTDGFRSVILPANEEGTSSAVDTLDTVDEEQVGVVGVLSGDTDLARSLREAHERYKSITDVPVVGEFELEGDEWASGEEDDDGEDAYDDEEDEDEHGRTRGSLNPIQQQQKKSKVRFSEWEGAPTFSKSPAPPSASSAPIKSALAKQTESTTTSSSGQKPASLLLEDVIERAHQSEGDQGKFNSELHQKEIAQEYHALRSRMMKHYEGGYARTREEDDAEEAMEVPQGNEGEKKKISRFKAARLGKKAATHN